MKYPCISVAFLFITAFAQSNEDPASRKPAGFSGSHVQASYTIARPSDSYEKIAAALGLSEVDAAGVLSQNPFVRQLSFVNPRTAAVWTDEKTRPNGWPTFYIAQFDGANRTNLIDLFYVRDGQKLVLTKGRFDQTLRSIARGMNILDVYRELGVEQCSYYQTDDKKWRVRFTYRGYKGSFIGIEADAASGVVLTARDGTI